MSKSIKIFVFSLLGILLLGYVVYGYISVPTNLGNAIQYLKTMIISADGGGSSEKLIKFNENGSGNVYIKGNVGIGLEASDDNLHISGTIKIGNETNSGIIYMSGTQLILED